MSTLFNRRDCLRALSAFGMSTPLLSRLARAENREEQTLVFIFLRGAMDGLSAVAPYADPQYQQLRRGTRLQAPGDSVGALLKLDGFFGLHPALSSLLPFYQNKQLAIVHAVGQPQVSRSHFEAQDVLELGGTLHGAGQGLFAKALRHVPTEGVFRAVALQASTPLSLSGEHSALTFSSLKNLTLNGGHGRADSLESLYRHSAQDVARQAAQSALLATQRAAAIDRTDSGVVYPSSALGQRLHDIAKLIRSGSGVRLAVTELGGFDTHHSQGSSEGALATRFKELGAALAAFGEDLGSQLDNVCVIAATEFGRTAAENGTNGTDHGSASAMFVMGAGVRGGRVIADWPGLAPTALFEGRDLRITTDIRQPLAECVERSLNVNPMPVFDGFRPSSQGTLF
jgi:uncharacterized protein (DUF1501 family)